jgi:transforming growth factor-beta-induced protein
MNPRWNLRHLGALTLLTSLWLAPVALPANHDAADRPDLVTTAVKAGSFNTLAAALKAADLVEALQGTGPFTVLAPTDEAFAKLPAGTVESLLKPENKAKLQAILKYHVISGTVGARKVAGLESAKTLSGAEVKISLTDGQLRVNQAKVVKTDVMAANGVIHVLDQVLLPPEGAKPSARSGKADRTNQVVRRAIERGVPLYNDGQAKACAAVYEVALCSLVDRPDLSGSLRHRLSAALAESSRQVDWSDRAWTLRRALDSVESMEN